MPAAIGFISTVVASVTTSTIAATALYYGTYAALSIGIGFGLNALNSALIGRPNAPRPQDVQIEITEPTAPRVRHYGRVKISGARIFAETERGNFHKVLAMGQGLLDAIESFWIDDIEVTRESGGLISSAPFNNYARVQFTVGNPSEVNYGLLTEKFPEWTVNHRGDGVSSLYIQQLAVPDSAFLQIFPKSADTLYRVIARASRVKNPVTGTIAWNDNASAVIMDYVVHPDGMRMPQQLIETPQAVAGWQEAYARANEAVAIAAGGTEPRYRLWGSYRLDERPADVLGRFLACCDGRLVPTPDGGMTLDIGEYEEPTVIIDETVITGFQIKRGRDIMDTANTVRATFLSPENDYQATDADPFANEDDVEERGEIPTDLQLNLAPSNGQARRLMKLALYRASPLWAGTLQCNLRALKAMHKRFVRVNYAIGSTVIDEVMEIRGFKLNIEQGILRGVTLTVQSMPAAAYQWDASQEGTAPAFDQSQPVNEIPLPTGFEVTIIRKNLGGTLVPFALLEFDAPPSAALKIGAEGKLASDTNWTPIAVAENATSAESFALAEGEEYEFRIRHVTIAFREGAWTDTVEVTAIGDETVPGVPSDLDATIDGSDVLVTWRAPNDPIFRSSRLYRGSTAVFGSATDLLGPIYGSPNQAMTVSDTPGSGTWYYWVISESFAGIASAPIGPVSETI